MKISCIAIDDEPVALDILEEYAEKTGFLSLKGKFRDALEGLTFIQQNPVDLIFLDINMPDFTGIQFARVLPTPHPAVIFCTAYSEYALESYDYEATDYLLKPISFERFLKAALKVKKQIEIMQPTGSPIETKVAQPVKEDDYIFVKTGNETLKIMLPDILFIEGTGNYITIHTVKKKIMSLQSMQEILSHLPVDQFIRIHKSYIISFLHIRSFERHQVKLSEDTKLPVGSTYRQKFSEWISKKN